jgi:hypothetical protein
MRLDGHGVIQGQSIFGFKLVSVGRCLTLTSPPSYLKKKKLKRKLSNLVKVDFIHSAFPKNNERINKNDSNNIK